MPMNIDTAKLTITEAAKQMGITPIGTAIKMKRWRYYINSKRFEDYMKGGNINA